MTLVVPQRLLAPIASWAAEHHTSFRANGAGRQYGILQQLTPPGEAWEIKQQVVATYGLTGCPTEPVFQDFCGYITEGGAIHPHQDSDHGGRQHVRYNVMVSRPEAGGMPIQDGVVLTVAEGEVWRCNASRVRHWCTPVQGPKPRIVLSFGFLV